MQVEVKKRRPRRKRWRRFQEGEVHRGTYIFPNLFTTANLFSGFFGIVNAIGGQFEVAALAIIFSCVFDILDGKVARLTRATSRFGVEYDSLADLVAFGVGPGLLMYLWALKPYGRLGWLAAFVFMACGALRLARFNVQVETVSKTYFVGLPIPGGAGMVATTVLFLTYWKPAFATMSTMPLLLMTYVLGFLMVSTLPYYSFKDLEFVKAKPLPILFAVVVMVSIIAMNPTEMLFALMLLYILSGPVVYVVRHVRGVQNPSPAEAPCPPAVEGPVRDQAGQQPAETERDGREQP